MRVLDLRFHRCDQGRRYGLYDARGIFVDMVCPECVEAKKRRFRPEIFTDPNYETTEPVEEE